MADKFGAFTAIEPPNLPLTTVWEVSALELLRRTTDVPSVAAKALGQLDRFGAIRIGPQFVGFDREDVQWSKVSTLRTRELADVLTDSALEREVARLRKMLPPVPGRKWALAKMTDVLGELSRAALAKSDREALSRRVVAEIDHRTGFGRTKVMSGGLFAAAVLGLVPEANRVLISAAQEYGSATLDES